MQQEARTFVTIARPVSFIPKPSNSRCLQSRQRGCQAYFFRSPCPIIYITLVLQKLTSFLVVRAVGVVLHWKHRDCQ